MVVVVFIIASLDDTYADGHATHHYPTAAYLQFGHTTTIEGKSTVHHYWDTFLRFLITANLEGATINSAVIYLVGYASRTDDFTAQINITDEDDAADFTNNPYTRGDGGTDVAWIVPDFIQYSTIITVDIASLLQAWIDRAGYNPNQHIAFRIKHGDAAAGEYQRAYSYDGDPYQCAFLVFTYTPAPPAGQKLLVQII